MNLSARDPVFPQIPQILESRYMVDVFQQAFFGSGISTIQVEDCQVGEKRYKPGKKFQVSYCVSMNHTETGSRSQQILTAKLTPLGDSAPCLDDAISQQKTMEIPPVSYLPEVSMLLLAFPFDRKLIHLAALLDTEKLKLTFSNYCLQMGLSVQAKVVAVDAKVMHYLPEESCMIRYSLSIIDPVSPRRQQNKIIYGKHYSDDRGAFTDALMRQLASQCPVFAEPIGYDAKTQTLFQANVAGLPCDSDVAAWFDNINLIANTAKVIAAFHGCVLEDVDAFGIEDISRQLNDTSQISGMVSASLRERINVAIASIQSHLKKIDGNTCVKTPLHLDLKLGNLLASGNHVSLIDLDCVRVGDPLIDISSFVANLYLQGIRAGVPVDHIDQSVYRFCQAYAASIAWQIDESQLYWYIAAALLYEVIRRSIRQQDPQRLQHLSTFIELSERFCSML